MAAEGQKPFACQVNGCGMSFSNEDHLNVHSKKHDMHLNLGAKSTVFVVDQTPTPTRLIQTCDEVGLFDDLLSVSNPFEHTFRRAVESKSKSNNSEDHTSPVEPIVESIIPDKKSNDDMLHTPHIFPNYHVSNGNETKKHSNKGLTLKLCNIKQKRQKSIEECSTAPPIEHIDVVSIKEEPEEEPEIKKKIKKEMQLSVKPIKILPKPEIIYNLSTEKIVTAQPVAIPINAIQCSDAIVKQKLKASILKSNLSILVPTAIPTQSAILSPIVKEKLAQRPIIQIQKPKKIVAKPDVETDKLNKNYANASNRAAAKRYRHRLKLKQEDLKLENTKLKEENKRLFSELERTKLLLAKHKDCNITRELNNNTNSSVGSTISNLNLTQPTRVQISYREIRKYTANNHYSVK